MNSSRKTAAIVGVLYIIGTVAGILSVVLTKPMLDAPDYLVKVHANGNQIITGAFLILIMGLALAMIPVMIFPISRKYNEVLALGYVVFRGGLETVTSIALVMSWLLLLPLSQAYAQAGAPDASNLHASGTLLLKAAESSSNIAEIVFPLGALMFYYLLYRSRLIPRWISGWGLIAVTLHLISGLLHLFNIVGPMSTVQTVLAIPIGLQEMVMAVWLLVKGFDPTAIAAGSARAELS